MQLDIPEDIEKLLLEISHNRDINPSSLAISLLLEKLEDLHDYEEGMKGYKSYLASGCQSTSMEDLRKELGLERA